MVIKVLFTNIFGRNYSLSRLWYVINWYKTLSLRWQGSKFYKISVDYIFLYFDQNCYVSLLFVCKRIEIARLTWIKVSISIPGSNKLTLNWHFDCEILIFFYENDIWKVQSKFLFEAGSLDFDNRIMFRYLVVKFFYQFSTLSSCDKVENWLKGFDLTTDFYRYDSRDYRP